VIGFAALHREDLPKLRHALSHAPPGSARAAAVLRLIDRTEPGRTLKMPPAGLGLQHLLHPEDIPKLCRALAQAPPDSREAQDLPGPTWGV
jgi:hypothetical protein